MRKRFISGLTAVCIVGILITNMITSASAVISAAVVGASVAGSLLLGTLFNQMCGGQGYDFTNKMSYGQYVAILEGKKKNKYDIHR